MSAALHRSRTAATVEALSAGDAEHRFQDARVLLTGDTDALMTANGAEMARTALQLLMRICPHVDIALPPLLGPLASDLRSDGEAYAWDERPRFVAITDTLSGYDSILSIGGTVRDDVPWTAITASGWIVRISSGLGPIDADCTITNPISALAAASMGVCEIFKRLIDLKEELGNLLDGVTLSLWDYKLHGANGPNIPDRVDVPIMVNGAGAIGSAIVHLLARLPLTGAVILVDKQDYADENWGTCLDLELGHVGIAKAEVAAGRLSHLASLHKFKSTIAEVNRDKLGTEAPWPSVVLNGLDGIDARHEAQDIWPDLAIDGALDADLQVRVSAHAWASDRACLRCLYEHPPGETKEAVQVRATGLSVTSLQDQLRLLTDEDIATADPAKRDELRPQLGKPICSVVSDAVARHMSASKVKEGFSPSVAFAASFSACLVLTEFVRYVLTGSVGVAPLYQTSLLMGPENSQHLRDKRHPGCLCRQQRHLIDRLRDRRKRAA